MRRPPPLEPPYDDEWPDGAAWTVPGDPLPFEESRSRPRNEAIPEVRPARDAVRESTKASELNRWASRFLNAVLEVIARRRPIEHLQPWATAQAVTGLRRAVQVLAPRDQQGRVVTTPTVPHTMHTARLTRPAPGVAEVCAVIDRADRYRALATRLEHRDGRWRCVVFRLL